MLHTIKFNELSAILVDFVDSGDGFLFLRLTGAEPTVNAIWARLSAREHRGKKWGSVVQISIPGQSYPQYVAAQKHITYRTVRMRLPSGLIDLALIHPILTVAEDSERGFHLLTYDDDLPSGFFDRLNKSLSIPLKPEWASWLWTEGQKPQSRLRLETNQVLEVVKLVEKTQLVETTEIPIQQLSSLGTVRCYSVMCHGRYRDAWLQIIRRQLKLGIRLTKRPYRRSYRYLNDTWTIQPTGDGWELFCQEAQLLQAPSLNHLLTLARETLGLYFILQENE